MAKFPVITTPQIKTGVEISTKKDGTADLAVCFKGLGSTEQARELAAWLHDVIMPLFIAETEKFGAVTTDLRGQPGSVGFGEMPGPGQNLPDGTKH
jgi:hypothetical protein